MKRIITSILLCIICSGLYAEGKFNTNEPFGWATMQTLQGGNYKLTGGNPAKTIVLQSNGFDMRADIIKSVKDYDVIVFDGSKGDFIVSKTINFSGLQDKTFIGVNDAHIRTQFSVTEEIISILDKKGVKQMSDQGGGGPLSNGAQVKEEREQNTRQTIIDHTGDSTEAYRNSGIFSFSASENIIIRNIAFDGPGTIDVGGADIMTVSGKSKHFWVDHCSFTDGMDGNFDINGASDFITISYCTFQYTDKAYDHRASNLITNNADPSQIDNFNITFAYCIWGEGCEVRMPVARFGTIHLLNNYYDCAGNYAPAINALGDSEFLIEGNYFEKGVKNIFKPEEDAKAWVLKNNIYRERFSFKNQGEVVMPYSYEILPTRTIPKKLRAEAGNTLNLPVPESSVKFTIHTIGDSTMADKDISNGNPERGWGMVLENFFDDSVRVINYAKNGRSTRSFVDQGLWDVVKANMRAGDYLFIQFAHNDQKVGKAGTYAEAWTDYQDYLRMFIRTAREIGATPVLCTSVARRHFKNNILDTETLGEYPEAMKAVAKETGTVLLDMESATIEWLSKAGDLASRPYFMWVEPGTCAAMPAGKQDNTHSNARGARRNCDIACGMIKAQIPELAKHLVRYDIVVDKDGRGDYLTVQEAINAVPDYRNNTTTILIKSGVYKERIIIPASKRNLIIKGCGANNTVLTYSNAARDLWPDMADEIGTTGSASVMVDASNVTFEDLSIRNDAGPGPVVGQAVALLTNGDCIYFHRCRIIAHQDTIYTYGRYNNEGETCRSFYYDCYIEGTTDFIFGPGTVLFENCLINSRRDSYITAASTSQGEKFGYVFKNCRFTAEQGITKVMLGRPWRDYANVVYLECELGSHIRPEGWHNWNNPEREKTAFYAEYKNFGPGADTSKRVGWSRQLTDEQAAEYTRENILRGWNPIK